MFSTIDQHLMKEPVLKPLIETYSLVDFTSSKNVFHDLLSCVIEQQIHYRSRKKQFAKLLERANLTELTPDNFSQFEENALPHIKLSLRKYETLERVVNFFQQNQFNWQEMTDEAIRETLGDLKGIGSWTVDMILLYTLERPDVFPIDDYHLKKALAKHYPTEEYGSGKKALRQIAEAWRPYRSTAVRYLLADK